MKPPVTASRRGPARSGGDAPQSGGGSRRRGSTARSSVTVAGWTLISRLTGLVRVVVIGATLGPTFFGNTFLSTNTIPNLTYSVVAGPVLGLVVVPVIVRTFLDHGPQRAGAVLGRLSGYLVSRSALIACGLVLAAPLIAWVLTFGIADDAVRGRAQIMTMVMLAFVAPQVVLYTVAGIGAAVQQARDRFALAAAAPAMENVGLIVVMGGVALTYGSGLEVDAVPYSMVVVLGLGSTAAVALHAGIQLFGASRVGLPVRLSRGWRDDELTRAAARRLRDSVAVAIFPASRYFSLLALAATVPGGVVVLQMANAVYQLPSALGGRAVSTATMPRLAEAAKKGNRWEFATLTRQAVAYAVLVSAPALLGMVILAEPIAQMLANGELRTEMFIVSLTATIAVFGVAQLFAGVHEVGRQALFARLDVRGPWLAGVISLGVALGVGLGTLVLPAGPTRLAGLAGAMLFADLVAAVAVLAMVRAVTGRHAILDRRRLAAAGLATFVMLPALGAAWVLIRLLDAGRVLQIVLAVPLGALGVAMFVLFLSALFVRYPETTAK